ncbi:MAG: cache domain-containing protein [Thermoanaerobaculaceae bacterium]|nr:cache domain-containing protein [Thermoanaerobaculaceae bacterium]
MKKLAFRTRLLLGFILVIGVVASVSTWTGFSFISRTVMKEAMLRAEMDLGAAWSAYETERTRVQVVVSMVSQSEALRSALRGAPTSAALSSELDAFRRKYDVDFLTVVSGDARVLARSLPPFATGDEVKPNPIVGAALEGTANSGTVLLSRPELLREGESLAERAYIPIVYTERATPTDRTVEERGMAIEAAIPVLDAGERVLGVVYGGVLLNRKFSLVDRIRNAAFGDRTYEGRPVGTVTIFLGDVRIATNVMLDAGTRALGTRISERVYDKVLRRGERFADRAFVVNDWYLSAYDPIRDPSGAVIGIIYVGLLEKQYLGYMSSLGLKYLGITFLSLALAAAIAIYLSSGFRRPILRLVRATRDLSAGNLRTRVQIPHASREVTELAYAFNSMAEALEIRNNELRDASAALQKTYTEAEEKNRAYLEMLGFVTHELKSPLASIVFAIGSLRDRILGPLNADQQALLKAASISADYLRDTIANYLNLSRIEEGEMKLHLAEVRFCPDLIEPLLSRLTDLASDRGMRIVCDVPSDLVGVCDPGLVASVFQNLLSNAIKYGREGGEISVAAQPDDDGRSLRFSVWNEGEGFERGAGEKLFQKFSRLTSGGDDTKSGTGLGLFVSQRIIARHGGRIWAESEPGRWAEFIFTLPVAPEQPQGGAGDAGPG